MSRKKSLKMDEQDIARARIAIDNLRAHINSKLQELESRMGQMNPQVIQMLEDSSASVLEAKASADKAMNTAKAASLAATNASRAALAAAQRRDRAAKGRNGFTVRVYGSSQRCEGCDKGFDLAQCLTQNNFLVCLFVGDPSDVFFCPVFDSVKFVKQFRKCFLCHGCSPIAASDGGSSGDESSIGESSDAVREGAPGSSSPFSQESEGQEHVAAPVTQRAEWIKEQRDWGIVIAALEDWANSFDDESDVSARRAIELAEQAMNSTGIFAQVVKP